MVSMYLNHLEILTNFGNSDNTIRRYIYSSNKTGKRAQNQTENKLELNV